MKTFGDAVMIYQPSVFREFRGEIFTTYHNLEHPAAAKIPQRTNTHVRFSNSRKGVLRGLHYDLSTWKLVQAIAGEIYLVVLDVRQNSDSYGRWESYILSDRSRDQILIPPGFANGHLALEDCIFHYMLFYEGDYVDEKNQGTISYDDPRFDIRWPQMPFLVQDRDLTSSEPKSEEK